MCSFQNVVDLPCRTPPLVSQGLHRDMKRTTGGFSFNVEPKKHESRVIHAKQRKRDHGKYVKESDCGADRPPPVPERGNSGSATEEARPQERKRSIGDRKYRDKDGDCGTCA